MSSYNINKGIGRTVEFRRLKAQHLFIFAGGPAWHHGPGHDTAYRRAELLSLYWDWGRRRFAYYQANLCTEQEVWGTWADEAGG